MKRNCILFMILGYLIFCNAFAQIGTDVIYLKNGSVIHGTIIEQNPGESLKIETKDGNIFVYQMNEVDKYSTANMNGMASGSEEPISTQTNDVQENQPPPTHARAIKPATPSAKEYFLFNKPRTQYRYDFINPVKGYEGNLCCKIAYGEDGYVENGYTFGQDYYLGKSTIQAHNLARYKINKNSIYCYWIYGSVLDKEVQYDDWCVFKMPQINTPTLWVYTDEDGTHHLKSYFGTVKTKYGNYDNCVIVEDDLKLTLGGKEMEEKVLKYYAKNMGLVKCEAYMNEKHTFKYGYNLNDIVSYELHR